LLAQILINLQEKRTIPEGSASFHTFATTSAEFLVDGIFEIWLLDKLTPDGTRGTHQILGCRIQFLHIGAIITSAQIAVAAYPIGMEALYSRNRQYTVRLASTALCTFVGVNLPKDIPFITTRLCRKQSSRYHGHSPSQHRTASAQEIPAINWTFYSVFIHHFFSSQFLLF
jgi:hypothetical protein